MNNLVREKLCEIVSRYGDDIGADSRRCESLLKDYCGAYKREINLIVSAVKEQVPGALTGATMQSLPREIVLIRLAQQLHESTGIAQAFANWAVLSWALALGVISPSECSTFADLLPAESPATQPGQSLFPDGEGSSRAAVAVVSKLGGDFKTIEEAIKSVDEGTKIVVKPGYYKEALVIDKPVRIMGDGPIDQVLIETEGASCLLMQADYAEIHQISIRCMESSKNKKRAFAIDVPHGQILMSDCHIFSKSLACIGVRGKQADPIFKRCLLNSEKSGGISVSNEAAGTFEDCEIIGAAEVGIGICEGADPVIRRCKILRGRSHGIFVYDHGKGLFEECNVQENERSGIVIRGGGNPTVRNSRIIRNKYEAIWVYEQGRGTIENCDLRQNGRGAWDISSDSRVRRYGNKE